MHPFLSYADDDGTTVSPDGDARRAGLALLPKLPQEALEARQESLVKLLDHRRWYIRLAALKALGSLPSEVLPPYYRKVIDLLNDPECGVRWAAIDFFRQQWLLSPDEVQPHTSRALARIEDPDLWVRFQVIAFLSSLPPEALGMHAPALTEKLEHEDGSVRASALMSLSRLQPGALACYARRLTRHEASFNELLDLDTSRR